MGNTLDVTVFGGRYRMVERLGSGGMSVVWRGYDEVLGRQVAVKVLDAKLAGDPAFRRRIRIEARAAARLSHPHITNVYDYGEFDGAPYVVMELVDGESMASLLSRVAAVPWQAAVTICAQVAAALAAAHERGLVHRDVTPSNVMLTRTGAKVVDFGISALVGESDVAPDGNLLGTPAYLAPERLDGGPVSPAADVYALGLLLYRAVTGHLPWQAATVSQILHAHRHTDPAPMPPVDGLPETVAELCQRCLAKRAQDRPSSAEAAATLAATAATAPPPLPTGAPVPDAAPGTTLLPWATGTGIPPPPRRPRRPFAAAMHRWPQRRHAPAVLAGVGLIALTGLLWTNATRSPGTDAGSAVAAPGPTSTPTPTPTATQPAACRVSYTVRHDSGSAFHADMVLTNSGPETLRAWQLTFAFPQDQKLASTPRVNVEQQGRQVWVRPAVPGQPLPPGGSTAVSIAGRYRRANPLPVAFALDGKDCEALVTGVSPPAPTSRGTRPNVAAAGDATESSDPPGNSGKGKGHGTTKSPKPDKTKSQ